jgi:hypothetical protein
VGGQYHEEEIYIIYIYSSIYKCFHKAGEWLQLAKKGRGKIKLSLRNRGKGRGEAHPVTNKTYVFLNNEKAEE